MWAISKHNYSNRLEMKRQQSGISALTQSENDFKRQRIEEDNNRLDASASTSRHTRSCDIIRMFVTGSASYRRSIARNKSMVTLFVLQSIEESLARGDTTMLRVILSLLSMICEEPEGRAAAIENGGIGLLLNAMQNYPSEISIMINSSASLCRLVHTKSPKVVSSLAAESEGIELVLDSMKRYYLCNPSIFGNIICILIGILIADQSRKDFLCTETIELCIRGMERHQTSVKVRRTCLTFLRLLTIDNPKCQIIVSRHIESIRAVMLQAIGDSNALEEGCGMLANICMVSEGREKILETGCVDLVLSSQLSSSSTRLQQFAALILSLLLSNNELGESISAFGGGEGIIDTLFSTTSIADT